MKMNFTVGMGRNIPIYDVPAHAKAAEECGFDMMGWVDQPNLSRDMYSSLTVAALNTSRIRLMSAVTDPITYHPSVTATAHATLNEVSGGRAVLGLGAGGRFGKSMRPRTTKEIETGDPLPAGVHGRGGGGVAGGEDALGVVQD